MGGAHSHEVGSVSGEDGSYPQTQLQATPRLKLEHLNQLCRESVVCGSTVNQWLRELECK